MNVLHEPFLFVIERPVNFLFKQFSESKNGMQRCAEFVAHAGQKLTLQSVGFLRLAASFFEPLIGQPNGLLRFLLSRHVANDRRNPESILGMNGTETDLGGEFTPVL